VTDQTPMAYWASRRGNRHPGPYSVGVVVCAPRDALRLLHPDHVPGQTIVHPQQLAAYHADAWAAAHAVPVGQVVELQLDALPVYEGRYVAGLETWRLQ
jgi:hypothetical protein